MKKLTKLQQEFINVIKNSDQPQGKDLLCSADGFCCLGLWMHHIGSEHELCTHPKDFLVTFDGVAAVLPHKEAERLQLNNDSGLCKIGGRSYYSRSLAVMNDSGRTFKDIAKTLEANPEYYFKNMAEEVK